MTVTKTKVKAADPVLSVIVKPARIESADINDWKNAVNAAKTGRCNTLYRLYENLLADGLLSRTIEKRIEAITNADLVFLDSKNERNLEIDKLIDTPEFELLLREIMLAKAWGISVIDVTQSIPFNVFSVPRRSINAEKKLILPDESSPDTGLPYEGTEYIFEVKDFDPLGFLYKVAPYVIYKRGGWGDWAQYSEIFGMPFRVAKYSAYDINTRNELVKSLKESGGKGWAVVPKEAEFEFVENKAGGKGEIYSSFIERCDKEILISVLGQTMTTIEGSSRAQSETHKEVEEGMNKSDRRFVQRLLNRHIVPILLAAGYPVKDGFFNFTEAGEVLTTEQKVKIAKDLKAEGIPVADDYFYEASGIPKPKAGETVSTQSKPETDPQKPERKPGEKSQQPEKKMSFTLLRGLAGFFASALDRRAPLKY